MIRRNCQKLLEERLTTYQSQLDALRTRDLTAFNELLRKRDSSHIITPAAEPIGQRPGAKMEDRDR